MGAGDPLVFACIASFVGVQPLSAILYAASLQALCFFLMGFKKSLFRAVPFGTFLALSALELSLFPDLAAQIHGIFRSII
jgi:prepilin signal peptidase PulO-like enzyme (type II secretory pathway)